MNICGRYDRLPMLNLYQDKPVFSLIISRSGREKPAGRCLESLLAQTFPDFEAACMAESAGEAKAEMPYMKDPRISILCHNGGNAFNEGLRHARGEYVLFMDAADLCEPDLLDLVYREILKTHGDVILFNHDVPADASLDHRALEEPAANESMPDWPQENPESPKLKYLNFQNLVCKKKFIYENRLFHQEVFASSRIFLGMTAFSLANKISFIDKILVHPGSGNKEYFSHSALPAAKNFVKLLYLIKNYIKEKAFYASFADDYIYWVENEVNKYKNSLSPQEEENLDMLLENYNILTL